MTDDRADKRAAWDRFGLLEIMLLIAALAAGSGMYTVVIRRAPLIGFLGATLVGMLLFGPMVLVAQFLRGRRVPLSVGEWFWLTPIFGPILFGCAAALHASSLRLIVYPIFFAWLGVMLLEGLFSVMLLYMTIDGRREERPCRWTDALGIVNATFVVPGTLVTFVLGALAVFAD